MYPEETKEDDNMEDIIQKQVEKNLNPTVEKEIESVDADKFSNNYLGESRYYSCQKMSNYTTYNSIKDLPNGVFQKRKLIDNPNSWKLRNDVNRPWDYIIN